MAEQANYQGEHIGLSLNRDASYALSDALERMRFGLDPYATAEVPLRLPDGRTLQLRLSLGDAGAVYDEFGNYLDDDGIAHGDVTGDLAAHAEARQVLDAAGRSDMWFEVPNEQLGGAEQVDLEEVARRRVDGAIERLPRRYGRTDEWVEQLRARALDRAREVLPTALDSTRDARRRALARQDEPGVDRQPATAPAEPERLALPPTTVERAEPASVRPPARLRNSDDDQRRVVTDHTRELRKCAAQAEASGKPDAAAEWTRRAEAWDESAAFWRAMATSREHSRRAADPDSYAQQLTAARTSDAGRTAGSDERSAGAGMAM